MNFVTTILLTLWNALAVGIGSLVLLMAVDIALGVLAAWRSPHRSVTSRAFTKGVLTKAGILFVAILMYIIDALATAYVPEVKPLFPVNVGKWLCIWFCLGQLISILEHMHDLGVPLPAFIVNGMNLARSAMSHEDGAKTFDRPDKPAGFIGILMGLLPS